MALKFKRILLKLSGEVLAGKNGFGFDFETIEKICGAVKQCTDIGIQVAVVVGGGNFWRGRSSGSMDRVRADNIGMLGTVMNAIAVTDSLQRLGVPSKLYSSIYMEPVAARYCPDDARQALDDGYVTVFGGGTGSPFFSTDTTAALRAAEIEADVVFKATNVDGVYDKDPNSCGDARLYEEISQTELLQNGLCVMDAAAASLCRDNGIDVLVFNLSEPQNIVRAAKGEKTGTLVSGC